MAYPFLVHGIVWAEPNPGLPSEATVMLSNHLVLSGVEDYEPEGALDHLDDLEEDEVEEFWDDYEPSDAAAAAWDLEWDREIKAALEALHGHPVLSFAGYKPAALSSQS